MPPCPPTRPARRAAIALAALCLFAAGATAAPLPPPLAAALADAQLPASHGAFFVQRVDADKPLVAHRADQPMVPASTMKLVTTYAALDLLGPAHTWQTEAASAAPLRDGRLHGDLYLRGSGDPSLTHERFGLLLRQLRARGVAALAGDLVLDRSAFDLPPHDPAAFDNAPLRPYNAGADALLVNFNSLRLALIPDPAAGSVRAVVDTPADGLVVAAGIALDTGDCGDWREKLKIEVAGDTIEIAGRYAAACGEKALHLSPWPADAQIDSLFRTLWRELGGSFSGRVRSGRTPADARVLAAQVSPPLGEIVRDVNKWSNNVMARQLFVNLAPTRPATPAAAQARVEAWLRDKGIAGGVLENGSGLSHAERLSAEGLGKLLLAAWKSPLMPELMASLPIAGSDGTLKKRLANSAAAGRAHLKTGYLAGVRAVAGYVLDRSGKRWVVVGLLNGAETRNGAAPLDALVRWVAER